MIHNEENIISQMKDDNQLAFTMLYNEYSTQVYSLAFKYLYDRDLAEDAVQNCFIKVWDKRKEIDASKPFNHYLFTIVKHELLNMIRNREKCITRITEDLHLQETIPFEIEEPEWDEAQLRLVRQAIHSLSPQKQRIVKLKISGKYSNQDIAEMMNLSINTIKFQYSQALKELRQSIKLSTISILLLWINL